MTHQHGRGPQLGAGVISDVFVPEERGTAYGFFYVGPLCGPVIGRRYNCKTKEVSHVRKVIGINVVLPSS